MHQTPRDANVPPNSVEFYTQVHDQFIFQLASFIIIVYFSCLGAMVFPRIVKRALMKKSKGYSTSCFKKLTRQKDLMHFVLSFLDESDFVNVCCSSKHMNRLMRQQNYYRLLYYFGSAKHGYRDTKVLFPTLDFIRNNKSIIFTKSCEYYMGYSRYYENKELEYASQSMITFKLDQMCAQLAVVGPLRNSVVQGVLLLMEFLRWNPNYVEDKCSSIAEWVQAAQYAKRQRNMITVNSSNLLQGPQLSIGRVLYPLAFGVRCDILFRQNVNLYKKDEKVSMGATYHEAKIFKDIDPSVRGQSELISLASLINISGNNEEEVWKEIPAKFWRTYRFMLHAARHRIQTFLQFDEKFREDKKLKWAIVTAVTPQHSIHPYNPTTIYYVRTFVYILICIFGVARLFKLQS